MAEYIDREALEIELNHRLSFLMAENGEYDAYTSGFDECVDRVENFQSAFDVAPVMHGRWVFVCERENRLDYECTNCRGHIQIIKEPDYIMAYKRCPNCGAKMDGGKNDS